MKVGAPSWGDEGGTVEIPAIDRKKTVTRPFYCFFMGVGDTRAPLKYLKNARFIDYYWVPVRHENSFGLYTRGHPPPIINYLFLSWSVGQKSLENTIILY